MGSINGKRSCLSEITNCTKEEGSKMVAQPECHRRKHGFDHRNEINKDGGY